MLLGKHKLLSEGHKGGGVVLEAKAGATTRLAVLSWHVKVRAHFDDGTTGEFDATLDTHQNGLIPNHELVLTPKVEEAEQSKAVARAESQLKSDTKLKR